MLDLINKELKIRASEVKAPLESIYFGGGTPSMIETKSIKSFINSIKAQFQFIPEIEIISIKFRHISKRIGKIGGK